MRRIYPSPFVYLGLLSVQWNTLGWNRNQVLTEQELYHQDSFPLSSQHCRSRASFQEALHLPQREIHGIKWSKTLLDLKKRGALTTIDGFNFWLIVKLYMRQPSKRPGRLAAQRRLQSTVDNKPLIYSPDRCVLATNWTHLMRVSFQTLTTTSRDENSFHF